MSDVTECRRWQLAAPMRPITLPEAGLREDDSNTWLRCCIEERQYHRRRRYSHAESWPY